MQELERALNGWVYLAFGADGLLVFSAHPLLYALLSLALALLLLGALAWWVSRTVRDAADALRLAAALALTPQGRRCLRLARQIRGGGTRLRRAVQHGIAERGERRALLRTLDGFTRDELGMALRHALRLIRGGDDARAQALRRALERQTRAWGAATDDAQREALQQDVARLRQSLARVSEANAARDAHLHGLSEAAAAVAALEHELEALHLARSRALPDFRDRLNNAARHLSDLRQAYRELEQR